VENANEDATVGQALMLLNGKTFTNMVNPYTMISRCAAARYDTRRSHRHDLSGPVQPEGDRRGNGRAKAYRR